MAGPDPLDAARKAAAEYEAQRKAAADTAASTGGPFGIGDPYEKYVVNPIAGSAAVKALPSWVRTTGGYILPQNLPELAVAALTAPIGGPAGSIGAKAAGKVATKFLGPLAKRALLAAGKGGLIAAPTGWATGHNPWESGISGTLGGFGGQLFHEGARAVTQAVVNNRLVKAAGTRVAKFVSELFPTVAGTDPQDVLMRVLNGELGKDIEKGMRGFADQIPQHPPGFDMTNPDVQRWVGGAIARGGDALPSVNGIPTPDLRVIWNFVPEARPALADRFLSQAEAQGVRVWLTGLGKAGAIRRWLTGAADPDALPTAKLQEIKGRLFNKAGEFTMEGLNDLNERFAIQAGELKGVLGNRMKDLGDAIWHTVGRSAETGTSGAMPTVTKKFPFVEGGQLPHLPGWETAPKTLWERGGQLLSDVVPPLITSVPGATPASQPTAAPVAPVIAPRPAPAPVPAPTPTREWFPGPTETPTPAPAPLERRPPSDAGWFSNVPATEPPSPGAFPKGEAKPEELEVTLDINKPP